MSKPFRVVLISPYSHISAIGLRAISAHLKQAGLESRMIFLPDMDEWLSAPRPHRQDYPPETLDQICELCADVDLVGIGVMSNFVGRRAQPESSNSHSAGAAGHLGRHSPHDTAHRVPAMGRFRMRRRGRRSPDEAGRADGYRARGNNHRQYLVKIP